MKDEAGLLGLVRANKLGVLTTIKRDGRPQLSPVNYAYYPEQELLKISVTNGRAKVANLRRDPRASFYVAAPDGWSYAVVQARAELSAVARATDDAAVEELIELYRQVAGEHPDWEEYRAAMVADQRLVLRLHIERTYGSA